MDDTDKPSAPAEEEPAPARPRARRAPARSGAAPRAAAVEGTPRKARAKTTGRKAATGAARPRRAAARVGAPVAEPPAAEARFEPLDASRVRGQPGLRGDEKASFPPASDPPAAARRAPPDQDAPRARSLEGDRGGDRRRGGLHFTELARRFLSTGVEALGMGEESVRQLVQEKVPREAVSTLVETALKSREEMERIRDDLTQSVSRGKEEAHRIQGSLQKVVAREVRRQIERLDLKEELARVFADYSLEVTARIALVPRDDEGEPVEPDAGDERPRRRRRDDFSIRLKRNSPQEDEERPPSGSPRRPDHFDDDDDLIEE